MTAQFVFLDAGPLGLFTQEQGKSKEADACRAWMEVMFAAGITVCVAEVTDYEIRRELIRAGKRDGVKRLDTLQIATDYVPITTRAMLRAADIWAAARNKGVPSADTKSLDADVVMAAQVLSYGSSSSDVVVATTNIRHIANYVTASLWRDIVP